ncbi:MAG: hypothetical protein ACP5HG_00325 [Anaerolineae bacterium]
MQRDRSSRLHRLRWAGLVLLIVGFLGARTGQPTLAQPQPDGGPVIDQLHLFLFPAEETLTISEYYLLGNTGDTVYTGLSEGPGEGVTVVFSLPREATNVRVDESAEAPDRYRLGANSIADTRPISPGVGTVETRFLYDLPLVPRETISRTVPLAVHSIVILLVGEAWQLEGPGLTSMGPMEVGGQTAVAYRGDPLAAGEAVAFQLVPGSPASGAVAEGMEARPVAASAGPPVGIEIAVGTGAVLAGAGLAAMLWRSPPLPRVPEGARRAVTAMAELDVRYAAGEVSEAAYLEERQALKARLQDYVGGGGWDECGVSCGRE